MLMIGLRSASAPCGDPGDLFWRRAAEGRALIGEGAATPLPRKRQALK